MIFAVKTKPKATAARAGQKAKRRDHRLSPDGKWRSFPKVPHLLQYRPIGTYYARVEVLGKLVRRNLATDVYSKAFLRLGDFLKEQRSKSPRNANAPTNVAEARVRFEEELGACHDMQPRAKEYWRGCVKALLKTWPGLDDLKLTRISEADCNEWAKRFRDTGYDAHYFNQTLSTLRHILDHGELNTKSAGRVKRLGVKLQELKLPEPDRFLTVSVIDPR